MVEKKHVLRKSINFCGKTKGLFYLVNSFLIWDAKKQPHNEVNPLLGKICLVVYSHQRRTHTTFLFPAFLYLQCLTPYCPCCAEWGYSTLLSTSPSENWVLRRSPFCNLAELLTAFP